MHMVISLIFSLLGLNQYAVRSDDYHHSSILRSPKISERNACFTFQYSATSFGDYGKSRMFVLIRVANNSQLLPLWTESVYDEREEWRTINILLAHKSGMKQVNRLFVN